MPIKLVFSALILCRSIGYACSCEALSAKEAFAAYDRVFSGEVSGVKYVDDAAGLSPRIVVTFKLLQRWKGGADSRIIMHTHRRDKSCEGFTRSQIQLGQKLLVYGSLVSSHEWPNREALTTDVCSRTQLLENAQGDLKVLRTLSANSLK